MRPERDRDRQQGSNELRRADTANGESGTTTDDESTTSPDRATTGSSGPDRADEHQAAQR